MSSPVPANRRRRSTPTARRSPSRGAAPAPRSISWRSAPPRPRGSAQARPRTPIRRRLEDELDKRTGVDVDVKNAGVGGELAVKTLERLQERLEVRLGAAGDLAGRHQRRDRRRRRGVVPRHRGERRRGRTRRAGVPLVLIDPQFTLDVPRRGALRTLCRDRRRGRRRRPRPGAEPLCDDEAAGGAKYAKALGSLLSGDGLHMNDLGYRCLAHALAEAIEDAAGAKL